MEDPSLLNKIMLNVRATSKYYTGYPEDLGPSKVIHFTPERELVQLLHQGHPMVVAFTIKCSLTKHMDTVLEEAAAEFDPLLSLCFASLSSFTFRISVFMDSENFLSTIGFDHPIGVNTEQ